MLVASSTVNACAPPMHLGDAIAQAWFPVLGVLAPLASPRARLS